MSGSERMEPTPADVGGIFEPASDREVWLPILGYAGFYEASNLGRIRRLRPSGRYRILVPSETQGYLHVSLSVGNVISTVRVHKAVLSAFCGPEPFKGAHAAHNDGDKINCRLDNLRWATPTENQADVDRHGRRCQGEAVFGAVLTEAGVRAIRSRIVGGERNPSIARDFGVSISTIHLIRHNKIWRHVA